MKRKTGRSQRFWRVWTTRTNPSAPKNQRIWSTGENIVRTNITELTFQILTSPFNSMFHAAAAGCRKSQSFTTISFLNDDNSFAYEMQTNQRNDWILNSSYLSDTCELTKCQCCEELQKWNISRKLPVKNPTEHVDNLFLFQLHYGCIIGAWIIKPWQEETIFVDVSTDVNDSWLVNYEP